MKAMAIDTKTRKAVMVTALAMVALLVAATPAFALGGLGYEDPVKQIPSAEGLTISEIYLGVVELEVAPIPDAGDWEMVPEQPVIPDAGDWEMVPQDPTFPDGGDDEPYIPEDEGDDGDDDGDVPDDSNESTPTPDIPEDEGDEDDTPSLPFTGGNAIGFAIAGIFVLLAGVLVLGRGLTARN